MSLEVHTHHEIDGIELGVLSDGTGFLTGRGLARLCGVAASAIFGWAPNWNPAATKGRDRKITDLLARHGYTENRLFIELRDGNAKISAFPDAVCMAVLEYYAFEADQPNRRDEALQNFRVIVVNRAA
jgi:hypothetical protein